MPNKNFLLFNCVLLLCLQGSRMSSSEYLLWRKTKFDCFVYIVLDYYREYFLIHSMPGLMIFWTIFCLSLMISEHHSCSSGRDDFGTLEEQANVIATTQEEASDNEWFLDFPTGDAGNSHEDSGIEVYLPSSVQIIYYGLMTIFICLFFLSVFLPIFFFEIFFGGDASLLFSTLNLFLFLFLAVSSILFIIDIFRLLFRKGKKK